MAIYSGFFHWKLWFSIAMWNYQRVYCGYSWILVAIFGWLTNWYYPTIHEWFIIIGYWWNTGIAGINWHEWILRIHYESLPWAYLCVAEHWATELCIGAELRWHEGAAEGGHAIHIGMCLGTTARETWRCHTSGGVTVRNTWPLRNQDLCGA